MKHIQKRMLLISSILFLSLCPHMFSAEQPPVLRRYAFIIGADNGGYNRTELEYASSDANSLAGVLYEMGGLNASDTIVLTDPDIEDVRTGFLTMRSKIASAGDVRRKEFIFYYSGHSDEQGLLLKGVTFPYLELKEDIQGMNADVHIAILDSCSSGVFTRLKGGVQRSPFMMDESVETRGHAYLTSSSEDEAAQESDSIEASFFTYYLIAALRGAADSTQDGKVTLNEAYSYAAEETLARTEQTLAGAQHASYDIQLAGSGDLVLTDLRIASSKLEVDSDVAGRLFIRDYQGRLVAELRKLQGVPLSFGLPSGAYVVNIEDNGQIKEAAFIIGEGRRAVLKTSDLHAVPAEITRLRGQDVPDVIHVYNSFTFLPDFASHEKYRLVQHLSAGLIGLAYRVEGFQFGLVNFVTEDVRGAQGAAIFNITGGEVSGGQGAGIFNITGNDMNSLQWAGIFNITGGNTVGFQGAGIFNITDGTLTGVQGGGIFNISDGDVRGAQLGGIFNITDGAMNGYQGAGIFNIAGNKTSHGAQTAGIFNVAEDFVGGQLALVNVAEKLKGAQVGLVNVGEEIYGTQIGLVNINEDIHGIPVGLVNISEKGLYHIQGWFDRFGYSYLALQWGSRNLYSIAYAGVPNDSPQSALAAGLGLGMNIRLGNLYVESDISAKRLVSGTSFEQEFRSIFTEAGSNNIFPAARLMAGFKVFEFLSLFGGVTFNGQIQNLTDDMFIFEGDPWQTLSHEDIPWAIDLYPSWTIGVRI